MIVMLNQHHTKQKEQTFYKHINSKHAIFLKRLMKEKRNRYLLKAFYKY